MKSITPKELKTRIDSGDNIQIIDVREIHEADICTINGLLIPMATILENTHQIKKDIPVIIHCRTGKRAAAVILTLEKQFNFDNLYNLEGGILQYADDVDPSLEHY